MATSSEKFSREAAFVLATEALQEAATVTDDDVAGGIESAPGFGSVEDAIHSFRRDPSDAARARLERATSDFRATQRATALARWRGYSSHGSTH
jgi:hypothetical protein